MPLLVAIAAAALLWTLAAGCRDEPSARKPPKSPEDATAIAAVHQRIREATLTRFPRAAFLSPHGNSQVDIPLYMATLIVEELGPADDPTGFTRFGRLRIADDGSLEVDTSQLTMYLLIDEVAVGKRRLQQHLAIWFYPDESPAALPRYRGVRTVVDERGFGILWEVLSTDQTQREFYISKSAERDAREAFGPPLAGRQYCVEPSLELWPDVLAVRAVGEGPQPMGPFVYVKRDTLRVTNLICRCEPAQADAFPQSTNYRLVQWPPPTGWSPPYQRLREHLAKLMDDDPTEILRLPDL